MAHYVEIKKEYVEQFKDLIAPTFCKGFDSLYNRTFNEKNGVNFIESFITLLKQIPGMGPDKIKTLSNDIIINGGSGNIILQLFRAICKINIAIYSNKNIEDINESLYKNIEFEGFVHTCYILCSERFIAFPNLFYKQLKEYELELNKLKIIEIVKNSIEQALRKKIPLDYVLNQFLNIKKTDVSHANTEKNLSQLENIIKTENSQKKKVSEIKLHGGAEKIEDENSSFRKITSQKSKHKIHSISKLKHDDESEYFDMNSKPIDVFGKGNTNVESARTDMIIKYTKENN